MQISLPRLNGLKPTLESTALKLMEEAGELAQAIGKHRGMSGEAVVDRESREEIASELYDVAQTAITMLYQLQDDGLEQSQRYCKTKEVKGIIPLTVMAKREVGIFSEGLDDAGQYFDNLINRGVPQEDARYLLPNACTTEIAVTMTFEHWQNFLDLRCDSRAQWEIRRVADEIKSLLSEHVPEVFA